MFSWSHVLKSDPLLVDNKAEICRKYFARSGVEKTEPTGLIIEQDS
jgi:hypothetical protein